MIIDEEGNQQEMNLEEQENLPPPLLYHCNWVIAIEELVQEFHEEHRRPPINEPEHGRILREIHCPEEPIIKEGQIAKPTIIVTWRNINWPRYQEQGTQTDEQEN